MNLSNVNYGSIVKYRGILFCFVAGQERNILMSLNEGGNWIFADECNEKEMTLIKEFRE